MDLSIRAGALGACVLVLSLLTGCASVTQGSEQSVRIDTLTKEGKAINDAECLLINEKGRTVMRSGQTSTVRRAGGDMTIQCQLEGQAPASGQAISRANAGLAGNIIIGGGIGAAIDVGTGSAYTYPTWMQLVFGQERSFDRSANRSDTPSAGVLLRELPAAAAARVGPPPQASAAVQAVALPPTTGGAPTAVPSGMDATTPLRRGDALEYVLTDRHTGVGSRVYYRVDRVEADEIVFNQGARVERTDGKLASLSSPTGGLFESASPPTGWIPSGTQPGTRWSEKYWAQTGAKWRHELHGTVVSNGTVSIEGQSIEVVRTRYEGWVYASASTTPGSFTGTRFQADVAYAPALHRVVLFDAEHQGAYGPPTRERLELVRIQR